MQKENRDENPTAVTGDGGGARGLGGQRGRDLTAGVLITSADIKDNTIRSADIRDETIKSRDVHNGSPSGVDVARNSLTGADLNESSLGKVPDANLLDGLNSTQLLRKSESFTRHFSCEGTACTSFAARTSPTRRL
jgi:hypothetical protein